MTEDEMKTKWCSQARALSSGGASYNRHSDGSPNSSCKCLGSGCAHWQWNIDYTSDGTGGVGTDSWTGKRVWDTENLRPKLVFVRKVRDARVN